MSIANSDQIGQLPAGYVPVPISEDYQSGPVTLCAVVRKEPDPAAGHLVVLRTIKDARVFLGALVDAGGKVQRWIEIWVQNIEGFAKSVKAASNGISNAALDSQWNRNFDSFRQADPSVIKTGWEKTHPFPTYLDLKTLRPVHPVDPEKQERWEICTDDALLTSKGLPPYSTSLFRYLYLPKQKDQSPFVRLAADSPSISGIRELSALTAASPNLIPLNPTGGLMMVRDSGLIRLEDFIDFLSGKPWPGVMHGRTRLDLGSDLKAMADHDPQGSCEGWLFMGKHGRWGRLLETFHLKLRLLHQAAAAVAGALQATQRPLLNLSADSFTVKVGACSDGLPFLWTSSLNLVDPGDAFAVPVPGVDIQYFVSGGGEVTSIYSPEKVGALSGQASIRIRQVISESTGILVEGTLATQERLTLSANELVWIRLNLAAGNVDLYCKVDTQQAMVAGEWRFRSIARQFTPQVVEQLKAASGVPITNISFEVLSLRSSPVDLYSLAILAVRTLLVNSQVGLPIAKDEILSLARQVASGQDSSIPLRQRIEKIFESDPRWLGAIGPHRLLNEDLQPKEVFDLVPPELWWDTLAFIVRLFPGMGKDSWRRDYGDAGRGGLHKVVLDVIPDLESLMLRTRSLIVIDWRFNREVNAAIRGHLTGLAGRSPASKAMAGT
jgi:hypothetical protein